jgi:hypothetical protein
VNGFRMNRKLSTEERVFVLQKWCQHDHSYRDVVDLFVERFPNSVPPSGQAIHNLNKRFLEAGSVANLPRSGRPTDEGSVSAYCRSEDHMFSHRTQLSVCNKETEEKTEIFEI